MPVVSVPAMLAPITKIAIERMRIHYVIVDEGGNRVDEGYWSMAKVEYNSEEDAIVFYTNTVTTPNRPGMRIRLYLWMDVYASGSKDVLFLGEFVLGDTFPAGETGTVMITVKRAEQQQTREQT